MEKRWTQSQLEVLNTKGSVLVSASAGTGKTAVLTEKVAKTIMEDNIDVSNILVMTFSNAAAEEMKTRILNRLEEMLEDESLNRLQKMRLEKQIRNFSSSNIQTIHSFCNDVIKKHFYKINLDSGVTIADNLDVAIYKRTAVERVLDKLYSNPTTNFQELESYIDKTQTIEDLIIRSYDKLMTIPNSFEWLRYAVQSYNISTTVLPDFLKNLILKDMTNALLYLGKAKIETERIDGNLASKEGIQLNMEYNCIQRVITDLENNNINAICEDTFENFGVTLRYKKDYECVKSFRNLAREIIDDYKKNNYSIKKELQKIKYMYPTASLFSEILMDYHAEYLNIKLENNVIDFSDMERYANEILTDVMISSEYKSIFAKIFIDEYQDTSPIQEEIIKKIAREDNLFCVGDLKQSIYRFRSSDPILFSERSKTYQMNKSGEVIPLNKNFRSSINILNCANDVFSYITKCSTEIAYTSDDTLVHGRQDDSKVVPVTLNVLNSNTSDDLKLTNDEIEIYNIVRLIEENLGKSIYDQKIDAYRPIEYNDFVILCRKMSGISDKIYKIFSEKKVPFFIEKSGQLLNTIEIQILINLLNLIKNPKRDIPIVSIMHLGLFGFDDDDIIDIKNRTENKGIYNNLLECSKDNNELAHKCNIFLNFLKDCRNKMFTTPVSEFINYILVSTHFVDCIATMENGFQKVDNINLFVQYAFRYEQKNRFDFNGFLKYIDAIITSGENIEEAKFSNVGNCVKITTIHKSKGLEYPIVILPFLSKAFSQIDKRANIIIDKDGGLGFNYYNFETNEKGSTELRKYVENKIQGKNIEEEMRLLYVAMTRAKEMLFVQGVVSNNSKLGTLENPTNMFDWILATIFQVGNPLEDNNVVNLSGEWKIKNVKTEELEPFTESDERMLNLDIIKSTLNIDNTINISELNEIKEQKFIPISVSASNLHQKQFDKFSFNLPNCIDVKQSASIGTITHNFLRYLNINENIDLGYLMMEMDRMVEENILSEDDADNININSILNFFNHPIGKKLCRSKNILREENIYTEINQDGYDILVRGTIDLLFECDNEWYLVDYKTDKFNFENKDALKAKVEYHKIQLDLYKKAVKKNYDIDLKSSLLVFLNGNIVSEIK